MTTSTETSPTVGGRRPGRVDGSDFDGWLAAAAATVRAIAARTGVPAMDADDLAHEVVVSAMHHGPSLMDRYPSATTYANNRFDHGRIDWLRCQAVQRGEGARFGRQQLSLSGPTPAGERGWDDVLRGVDVTSETALERLEACDIRSLLDRQLDQQRARALLAVKAYGLSAAEYAGAVGVARETVCRWVGSANRDLAAELRLAGGLAAATSE